ncbi:CPBP family intramembrane glutamic endopeptidase [Paraclostridium bifermentans]|uniref:CPBP family intramembrane glutamic endopeptidase n=1 Tax=Paraclostridium bifermentans TaxID=1490 RepID=UPI0018AA5025|nr:type II CAAX endopeptidase family protein [Paraclostridium bifermentans]
MFLSKENLFDKAKESKYLPNFILGPLLAWLFIFIGTKLGILVGPIIYKPISILTSTLNLNANSIQSLVLNISLTSGVIVLIFLWVRFVEKRRFSSLGFDRNNFILKYLTGFIIGIIMMSATVALLYLFGLITVDNNTSQVIGGFALSSILLVIPAWMIQSAMEEIIARGWLLNVLGARYTPIIGLIISSVFFGLVHLENPGISFIAILNIILVGLFLGLCVIKTNNLWVVCGIHASWNFSQGNIFGFKVSGSRSVAGSIFNLNLRGNELMSGGDFGPEAGLCATIVLIICTIIIALILKNKNTSID